MGWIDDIIDAATGGGVEENVEDNQTPPVSDGSSDSGTVPDPSSVAPDWLTDYAGVFKAFGSNPVGFILGAVLSTILGGIQTLVSALIDAILFLALGSDYTISATGTLGIADIPVFAVSLVTGSAGTVVGALTSTIRELNRAAVGIATAAGPLSPVIYAAILAAAMIALAWALRTLIAVIADAVPGLQGVL